MFLWMDVQYTVMGEVMGETGLDKVADGGSKPGTGTTSRKILIRSAYN